MRRQSFNAITITIKVGQLCIYVNLLNIIFGKALSPANTNTLLQDLTRPIRNRIRVKESQGTAAQGLPIGQRSILPSISSTEPWQPPYQRTILSFSLYSKSSPTPRRTDSEHISIAVLRSLLSVDSASNRSGEAEGVQNVV